MSPALLAIIVSAVAVVALIVLGTVWFSTRRARAMRAFAGARGLSYMGRTWVLGDCDFALFGKGFRRGWRNVLTGAWNGTTVVYADYEFAEHEGRASHTYVFSIVVTDLGCVVPEVAVTARSLVGELASQLDADGVRFAEEEFQRRFVVHSDDERFARELIDGDMMHMLLAAPDGLHVHFGPDRMILWGQRRAPAALQALLDAAASLDQRVPVVVRHDYAGAPERAATGGPVF